MSKAQHICCKRIWVGGLGRYTVCGKPAKAQNDAGDYFCGIHSPSAVAKRNAKRDARDAAERKKWADAQIRRDREIACVKACEGISTEVLERNSMKEVIDTLQGVVCNPELYIPIAKKLLSKIKGE